MRPDDEIGSVEDIPAGDDETGKHPANDPAPTQTGELGGAQFRDREAQLAKEAGERPRPNAPRAEGEDQSGGS